MIMAAMATDNSIPGPSPSPRRPARAEWMARLSLADPLRLEAAWNELSPAPRHRWLRPVETGLVMLRGRAGGTGQPFNLGEMTVTRAAVMLDGPRPGIGFGYVAGRAPRHAELAALFDALLQGEASCEGALGALLADLQRAADQRRQRRSADVASTRVDFTTMVRGDD
jgi:alpha-D-ribose 1-methylphosphonate 5-triphosphate synthase subunit PhnG